EQLGDGERDGERQRGANRYHREQRQRHGHQRRFVMAVASKTWKALGTSVHVLATDPQQLPAAEMAVREILDDVDAAYSRFRVDSAAKTVHLPEGVELDLGSTGKALAADLAAHAAHTAMKSGGVLVSLGGDIAVAGDSPEGGWRVLVAEDSAVPPDSDGQVICVGSGGVATSSTTVRRWTRGGTVLHHIIDPKTGLPSSGPWRTVTVVARTCVDANIAATAAIVQGEAAVAWLQARHLPARLVENDGTIHYIGPWPDPDRVAA